ncbi:MAG: tetratricopeptide repeat protein [Chlamydiota bacterium]|jgi:tetratricopeptide (TPR) repeat protein
MTKIKASLFFLIFVWGLSALSDPILAPPPEMQEEVPFPHPQTANEWYEWGLIQIREKKWDKAKQSLEEALFLDPELIVAKVQLGFLELWQHNLSASYQLFLEVLEHSSCESHALEGFREIGLQWAQEQTKQQEEVIIYEKLNSCEPNNPDTLFYLGRSLARTGNWEKAKEILQECLRLAPQYSDAEIQLAYIYLWEGKTEEAEALFIKYPNNSDAKLALARIARQRNEHDKAKKHLEEILSENPEHPEAKKEYANVLYLSGNYFEAENEFSWLIDNGEDPNTLWLPLFDIGSHTRYALWTETLYTDAKENDPDLSAPVVKDYYFYNAVHVLIPLTNMWRLDIKQIYYHQRENDIYPPVGVNYSAYYSGGQITSNCYFCKNWQWDLFIRIFHAWGSQNQIANFPFESKTRYEPGTGLRYSTDRQLFFIGAHSESFIIKDFSSNISKLLGTINLTAAYTYRFDWILKPEVQASVEQVFIKDNLRNWRNTSNGSIRFGLPYIADYVKAIYFFEYGHFDKLSINYYSFREQVRNAIGGYVHVPITSYISWDTTYYHRWQLTRDLFQPIGNQVFVAQRQLLVANWVTSEILVRYKDKMRLALEGHYFRDNLPYRDWGITGSFLWQF